MTRDSRIAYERSAMIAVTFVFWIGTLLFFVPFLVSVFWTVAVVAVELRRARRQVGRVGRHGASSKL